MKVPLALALLCATVGAVEADDQTGPDAAPSDPQLVLLNASSSRLRGFGQLDRIARVLEQRRMLVHVPEPIQAALEGRNSQVTDLDAIRDAYVAVNYDAATRLIDADERRLLQSGAGSDVLPALAQLALWRGLIAVGQEQNDEAIGWFRAAYRFNPAQEPDKRLTAPRIRAMIKKARREPEETGKIRIDAEPDSALVQVDGGKAQPCGPKIELPIGTHVVQISAEGTRPYAELVDVKQGKVEHISIRLDPATATDKAAKVVDATIAAPAGAARLKRASALTKLVGATRILVVEDGGEDHLTLRIYDIGAKKVSQPLELAGDASSTTIARTITAALDANLVDAGGVVVIERDRSTHWYQRWYVWAAAAAVVGGGVAGYELMQREPTSVRGF